MSQNIPLAKDKKRHLLLNRIEKTTELPLTILALLMIPLILGPFLFPMDPETKRIYLGLEYAIWMLFLIDLVAKLVIAPNKIAFLRSNWIDVLLVVIPWLRPLRLIRVVVVAVRVYKTHTRLAKLDLLIIYTLVMIISSATIVGILERGQSSPFLTYHDTLWWAVVTITTVGYGDFVPVTAGGRIVALILMWGGIAIFGALTANLASFFVKSEGGTQEQLESLTEEVKNLRLELATQRRNETTTDGSP